MKEAALLPAAAAAPEGQRGAASTPPTAPAPAPSDHRFRVTQATGSPNCGTTMIVGEVRDVNGNPLNGVTIRTWNDWAGNDFFSVSGGANWPAGHYDRIIGGGVRAGRWYAAVVEQTGGRIISPVVTVDFTGSCEGGVQAMQIDFQAN